MKNKLLKTLGALVLGAGLSFNSYGQKADKEIPCLSNKEVEFVVSEIPKHFKQTSEGTYLIENIPEAKNGYGFGGQLSVYIPYSEELTISIFDRTNINSSKWYNISNWDSENKGCVDDKSYLNINPAKFLEKKDAQIKFNEFVYKVKNKIKK